MFDNYDDLTIALSTAESNLKTNISIAPSIGTIVGETVELDTVEAQRAHLVANSDAHLEGINNRITVAAYSKLNTSLTSEHSGNHEVDVAINAYADAPYLSVDASVGISK